MEKSQLINKYIEYVLTHGEHPKTVYMFAKELEIEEPVFYEHFSDFESLEKEILASYATQAIDVIENSEEAKAYDNKQKLIAFYYTFFEVLTKNRSFVLYLFKGKTKKMQALKSISKLRKEFVDFIRALEFEKIDFKQDKLNKIQDKGMNEMAWLQLLYTIQFWVNDSSKGFEKTDLFIEKSLRAGFDLTDLAAVNSVFDLAKFLYKEKTMA